MKRTILLILVTGFVTLAQPTRAADIRQVSAQACADCNTGGWCSDGCGPQACGSEGCNACGSYCDPCGSYNGRKDRRRQRREDFGLNWTGDHGPIGRPARWCKCARCVKYLCDSKAFPDSGWAPPAHTPIRRTGATYTNYYPNTFYGSPGGGYGPAAPMVYQPTDTAQLGYSYGHVPRWRPDPSKIPPVPSPSNFHARFCPCESQCSANPGCMTGSCHVGGMIIGQNAAQLPQGYVKYTPQRRKPVNTATAALVAKNRTTAKPQNKPVAQPKPQKPIQTVSTSRPADKPTTATPAVASTPSPKPFNILDTPAPAPKKAVAKPAPPRQATQQTNRPTPKKQNRTAGRRTGRHRTSSTQGSGGWLGLPSLSQMRIDFE